MKRQTIQKMLLNTDDLSEESKAKILTKVNFFCKGEYEGDLAVLQSVVENDRAAGNTDRCCRKTQPEGSGTYLNIRKMQARLRTGWNRKYLSTELICDE